MAFLNSQRFPVDISFGATSHYMDGVDIVSTESGWEQRNSSWSCGLATYDVAHAARILAKYKVLYTFYRAVRGRLHGFRYKDWLDYQAIAGEGVIVTLSGGAKQLAKTYTAGVTDDSPSDAIVETRLISKPVAGTVTITGGGSLDYNTGIVTGGTPTAWVGEFDVPVRFDTQLAAEIIDDNKRDGFIVGWSSILLKEIRV